MCYSSLDYNCHPFRIIVIIKKYKDLCNLLLSNLAIFIHLLAVPTGSHYQFDAIPPVLKRPLLVQDSGMWQLLEVFADYGMKDSI